MKIVHVVQRFRPAIGGAETHVLEVAREQARRGHEVTIATSAHADAAVDEHVVEHDGTSYHVHRFPARHFRGDYLFPPWLPMPGLKEFLVSEKPDLYHAHSYRFATIEAAAAASRATGRPMVATAHGFYPPENAIVGFARRRYDRARGREALKTARRCVAVTRHEIDHYEKLGVPRDRVDVVPNGIPEQAFAPGDGAGFRKRHGLGTGPLVVFLARLSHDKGVRDLVEAATHVPEAAFAICGRDAGERAPAERLVARLGLRDRVRFVGPVRDPRDAYAAAQVFVLPSHYEAFGIVLLEAMAQARPVVATTAGGMPEVVDDAGLLAPPHDPRALAGALRELLGDEARRTKMGERALERARSFLWPHVVDRLEETYALALRE